MVLTTAVHAAMGEHPFDLLIRGVRIVNVFNDSVSDGSIGILDGRIVYAGPVDFPCEARETVDGGGRYALPGFVDAHMHLESSMLTPAHFAETVMARGTTTVAADPHEIANVLGRAGVETLLAATKALPLRVLVMAPSTVPSAPGFEASGYAVDAEEMERLLALPGIAGLGEVMDFNGVAAGERHILSVVEAAKQRGFLLDGHASILTGRRLQAFRAAGIDSDHTTGSAEKLREELALGFTVQIQSCMVDEQRTQIGTLKSLGYRPWEIMPILILGHTPKEQVGRLIECRITQAVTCEAKALEYSQEAVRHGGALKIHIKVDSGMSRLGYLCAGEHFESGVDGICRACRLPGLEAEGIFTHFAVSDEPDEDSGEYTRQQFALFTRVIDETEKRLGRRFSIRHCANTGAVACYPETFLDMVRPGLLLYGYGDFAQGLDLRPVMTLKTTVSTIKVYEPGTSISYGRIFKTERRTRMGVVPYGYADGFFRSLSNKCSLMTAEGPVPQRGKICMDMCMIDLTELPGVEVGDEVEIFGKRNPVEILAATAGTIPYELTCAVSRRVPRVYFKNGREIERELMLRF